jgi:DNA-binding MarR family transcriptional regulator
MMGNGKQRRQEKRSERRQRLEAKGRAWAVELGCDLDAFGVGSNLHWAMLSFQNRLEQVELVPLGLSMSEFVTLWTIQVAGETPSTVVAAEVGLAPSGMTGLLGRLERRGLVTRRKDPDDGRGVLVEITDDGRRAAAEAFKAVNRTAQVMTGDLAVAGKKLLADSLRSVADRLDAAD